ncbi:MAG TPA: hypothetical protein PKB14_24760 [Rubrivivax sp.]|nr:hypothetical protein [Rubrivivax sp.]
MATDPALPDLDALADAIALRLARGMPMRGGPLPELPQLPDWPPGRVEPDLAHRTRLAINGIELIQVTQHFQSAHGADNSVPLVALKPMVVRAYPAVQRGVFGGDALTGQRAIGELVLSQGAREVYRTGPTRSDGARVGPAEHVWRELWDEELTAFLGAGPSGVFSAAVSLETLTRNPPLSFRVPAWYLRPGRMTATVRLHTASGYAAVRSEDFTLIDVRAPKVAVVAVDWVDANGKVNAPSDADMLGTLRLAERMLPFPYFESTILGTRERRSGAFAMVAASGDCNPSWNSLLTSLALTRIFTALFQLGDIVFGFVPTAAIPGGAGRINAGCGSGSGGVGGGFVGYENTFAHEIGHIYARNHVWVPNDPDNDTAYPKYGGDRRSIGEVGLDLGTSPVTVYTPDNSDDIMSYGDNLWISPYTYRALIDARFNHQSAPADPRRVRELLVVAFRISRLARGGRSVEFKAMHRIDAAGSVGKRSGRAPSQVSIDFIDANERIVASHHCFASRTHASGGCCCSGPVPSGREPWLDFVEAVDWPTEQAVTRLQFNDGSEQPIAEVALGGEAPSVELEGPHRVEGGLELVIRAWPDNGTPRSALLLFSNDDGQTWIPAQLDPPLDVAFIVDPLRLRGGATCRFRAVVTIDLQAGHRDSEPFDLPAVPRGLHLRLHVDDCVPHAARLAAFVDTRGLGGVAAQDVAWQSDRDGDLGRGYGLWAELSEGQHVITATIPDGLGHSLSERGIIIVGGRPRGER